MAFSSIYRYKRPGPSIDSAARLLTFAEVDLEGQEVRLDSVLHQVLQRDQELHCFLQGILGLKTQIQSAGINQHWELFTGLRYDAVEWQIRTVGFRETLRTLWDVL